MSTEKTFRLDGKAIPFEDGETVMDAALKAGEYIPHLCHNPDFEPHGSCRVCVVDVNGRHQCSCTLPASEGMEVDNSSEAITDKRRTLLQMLFVEGNHICPACEKSGGCQLQAVAYQTGMLSPHFTHFFPKRSIDASHPDLVFYFNRCILCGLCVRVSRDIDKKSVFALSGRGSRTRIISIHPAVRPWILSSRSPTRRSRYVQQVQCCPNTLAMKPLLVSVSTTACQSASSVMPPTIFR